jgi:hypothetical protein
MSRTAFASPLLRGLLLAAFVGASALLMGGDRPIQKSGQPFGDQVEMFKAIKDGQIAVKLIPKDATQCRVMIENKTDKPLSVKLPDTFVGVPVLPQFGAPVGGHGGSGGSHNNSGNQNQSMGGGMGGYGGGGMGGGGMGMFNLPPEKTGQMKIPTVCLEHGKKDPTSAVPYEIRPLDSFTQKEGVKELMQMFGSGKLNQRAVQAAAWNLNNDLPWPELASKQVKYPNGMVQGPYFKPQEIQAARQLAATAQKTAQENKEKEKTTSPSLGDSLSAK